MNLEEFRMSFEKEIVSAITPSQKLAVIVASLGTAFCVGIDEIAIFAYDRDRDVLVFVWPESLKAVGSIPLNAHRCLVAKTAAERQGHLDNSFASTPHLYMFEHFLADKKKRVPIQRIMSAPVMRNGQLASVVQVARKGADRDSAGADFTARDLELLTAYLEIVARYL